MEKNNISKKQYDLVLIHGFSNRHQWGDEFLRELSLAWVGKKIILIYINESNRITRKSLLGSNIIAIGENTYTSGKTCIDNQVNMVSDKVNLLIEKGLLSKRYNVIGHSLGGIVARGLVYKRPNEITDLVTIASPHKGTKLVKEYQWISNLIGGTETAEDLNPQTMEVFNQKFSPKRSPLVKGGKIYTVSGRAGPRDRGWNGEIALGWSILKLKYNAPNDGLIIEGEDELEDITSLGKYKLDHLQLIQSKDVARKVAKVLH